MRLYMKIQIANILISYCNLDKLSTNSVLLMSGFLSLTLNNRYNENATSPGAAALNLYGL